MDRSSSGAFAAHGKGFRAVTEKRKTEQEIRRLVRQNDLILNATSEGIFGLDTNGNTTFVNPAAAKMTGWETDELIGKHQHSILHHSRPDGSPYPKEECPIYAAFRDGATHHRDDEVFWRKDGSSFPVEYTSTPIKENGKTIGAVVSFRDITERKRSEAALRRGEESLRESEHRLKLATASAKIGVWDWDIEHNTLKWDDQMFALYGIRQDSFSGRVEAWQNGVHPDDRTFAMDAVRRAVDDNVPYDIEFRVVHLNGTLRTLKANGLVIRKPDGTAKRMIGVNRDITEERRAKEELIAAKEAAERVTRLKSSFLDIAAHELRTPVTAFSALLQLSQIQLEKGHPVTISTLKRLRGQTDRLARLVLGLLEVSRLERGVLVLRLELADLVSLISECVVDFTDREPKRSIVFAKPKQPIEALMDPTRIHQVISNLIDNAIKYTPAGSPIEVTIDPLPDRLRVSVIDHGEGIPEALQEDLFKLFSKGTSDQHEQSAGLGLGLFICHEIMKYHHGNIGVVSKPGGGSRFYFELPIHGTKP